MSKPDEKDRDALFVVECRPRQKRRYSDDAEWYQLREFVYNYLQLDEANEFVIDRARANRTLEYRLQKFVRSRRTK